MAWAHAINEEAKITSLWKIQHFAYAAVIRIIRWLFVRHDDSQEETVRALVNRWLCCQFAFPTVTLKLRLYLSGLHTRIDMVIKLHLSTEPGPSLALTGGFIYNTSSRTSSVLFRWPNYLLTSVAGYISIILQGTPIINAAILALPLHDDPHSKWSLLSPGNEQ